MQHTLESWRKSTEKVEKWKSLVESPLMVEALDVLTRQFLHSRLDNADIAAHALQGVKRDGYYEFLFNIRALGRPHDTAEAKQLPDPWKNSAAGAAQK